MKRIYFIFILFIYNIGNAQQTQIIDKIFENKLRILSEEKILSSGIVPDTFEINEYLENIYGDNFTNEDSARLVNLIIKQSQNISKSKKWKPSDFENIYLLKSGERVNIEKYLKTDSLKGKKEVRKAINIYNNNSSWTNIPVKISDIVISDDNLIALVEIIFGNNGGQLALFQNDNDNWALVGYLERWAF